jgi:hypothetical protein
VRERGEPKMNEIGARPTQLSPIIADDEHGAGRVGGPHLQEIAPCTDPRLPLVVPGGSTHILNSEAPDFSPHLNRPCVASRLNPLAEQYVPRNRGGSLSCYSNGFDQSVPRFNFSTYFCQPPMMGTINRFNAGFDQSVPGYNFNSYFCQPPVMPHLPQGQVRSVWRHNCASELSYLSELLKQCKPAVIGFDMEYAAPAPEEEEMGQPPQNAAQWYHRVRSLVNHGDVVQLGLVLQYDEVNSHSGPQIFEINMFFDPKQRSYNPVTIKFLERSGHRLEIHTKHGVMPDFLGEWMKINLEDLRGATWVMFQGDNDASFLMRSFLLEQFSLPPNRIDFLQVFRSTFPKIYDVRVLGLKLLHMDHKGFSLSKLGTTLGKSRLGRAHSSASDALLTLDCFLALRKSFGDEVCPLAGVLCGLYGSEELVRNALPVYSENLQLVHVSMSNFQENASFVVSSAENNFSIIGLHAELDPIREYQESEDNRYNAFRTCVDNIMTATITVAMANADGQLAGGKIWEFNICFAEEPMPLEDGEHFVPAGTFAEVLMSHLLIFPNMSWVTFHGAELIASILRCLGSLPSSGEQYILSRSDMFPWLYDISMLTEYDNSTLLEICQRLAVRVERSTGEQESTAVLIVSCFLRILETAEPSVLEDSRGQLRSI